MIIQWSRRRAPTAAAAAAIDAAAEAEGDVWVRGESFQADEV